MILFNVKFGRLQNRDKSESEDLIQDYLASLLHSGQACGEYFFTWTKGILNAHISLAGRDAFAPRYHSIWGKRKLEKITEFFGQEPIWIILDDELPNRNPTWKTAPCLYFYTNAFDWEPPIRRGDNGLSIPTYRFPISYETRQGIYSWSETYRHYDNIWLGCGVLEIPVYKQLADPFSQLSEEGREVCRVIEKATGVPTYYYLMRYWGRRRGESERKCPGCGSNWRGIRSKIDTPKFWHFAFQCKKCRLVSHEADCDDDERYARIGEHRLYKGKKRLN